MTTVRRMAAKLSKRLPRSVDLEDLVGAGSLGLAEAFTRRGAMIGSEVESFDACRIRGAVLDELRRLDSMTRCSRRAAKRIAKACRAAEQKLGRPAFEGEIAAELGIDLRAYQALRAQVDASHAPVSFTVLGPDNDELTRDIADPSDETPDALVDRARLSALITSQVGALSERKRAVLMGVYVENRTLKEIGLSLGLTESRVCQIRAEALAALRLSFLHESGPDERL